MACALLAHGFFIALQVEITPEVLLHSLLRCLLVIFMYFASFYRREKKKNILVKLLISRILEEVNVDQMYHVGLFG